MAGLEKAGIHTDRPMDSRFRGNDGLGGQPDGVVVEMDGAFFARRRNKLLRWSFSGYTQAVEIMPAMQVKVLTPPSILAILRNGYQPRWHSTASQWDD